MPLAKHNLSVHLMNTINMPKHWILPAMVSVFFFVSCNNIPVNEVAGDLHQAHRDQQAFPVLTSQYPGLKRPAAYAIQRLYVRERIGLEKIAGYKAALTSAGSRQQLNSDRAITGVLFGTGWKDSGDTIQKDQFIHPLLETEIGYVIKKPIIDKLRSVSDVRSYLYGVVPAMEIPDVGFPDLSKMELEDFIATNSGSAFFVLGEPVGIKYLDTNDLTARVTRNGQLVNTGKGKDAMGNQWDALFWLINHIIDQGYTIGEGQVLLTGALGQVLPCEPGHYVADFGSIGRVELTVE